MVFDEDAVTDQRHPRPDGQSFRKLDGERVVGMVSDRDILLSVGWLLASEREVKDARGAAQAVGPVRLERLAEGGHRRLKQHEIEALRLASQRR